MECLANIKNGMLICGMTLLVACGGGGGGGGSSDITYSGSTNQAVLTADNDGVFGTTMLEGSATNKNASPFPGFANVDSNTSYSKKRLALLEELANQFQQDIKSAGSVNQHSGTIAAVSGLPELTGTCGGNVTYSGNESMGSVVYNNYCVGSELYQLTFNGSMSYSYETIGTSDFRMTVNFSNFTVEVKQGLDTWSETTSGSITILKEGSTLSVTFFNLFERDGKIYKIEDLSLSGGLIQGRLYHPDYGYVVITTDPMDPFIFGDNGYCGGTLIITGVDSGGLQVSSTMVVADDCSTYTMTHASSGLLDVVKWR